MNRPTVMEEVFAAVKRVAPDLTLYVAFCDQPGHSEIAQLSNAAERFCNHCGHSIAGTPYKPEQEENGAGTAVQAGAPSAQKKGEAA
jgi:hypothetical protein